MFFLSLVNVHFITPLSNRILIHDLQEVIEKQFDVKEDMPGRHSYAKYNSWDKVQYKMPVLPGFPGKNTGGS